MAEVVLSPAEVTWEASVEADLDLDRSPLFSGDVLVPYNSAHYLLDEYRMKNGWPVAPPTYDVRALALTSVTGDQLTHRPHPAQVVTGAAVRWIAGDLFDTTALKWRPSVGYPGWTWDTSAEYAPTLVEEYSYRVDREILPRTALRFTAETRDHLWSNFTGSMSSATSFSVLMVLSISASDGPSGILCPGHPTPGGVTGWAEEVAGSSFSVHLRARQIFAEADQNSFKKMFPIAPLLASTAPAYLGITVDPPYLFVFMGAGPSQMRYAMIEIGNQPNNLDWVIGRSTGTLLHGADMSLFDVSFYVDPLSKAEMVNQIAILAGSYGGT